VPARDVRRILLRVQRDDDFYRRLLQDPDDVLTEYSLTAEERDAILRQDQSLYRYLIPSAATVPERAVSITITITGEHDWFNVSRLRDPESLSPDILEQTSSLAERVLGLEGAERVEMLMTMLQLLDGRQH